MYEEAQKIRAIMKEDGFLSDTELLPSADFTEKTMAKIRAAKKPTIIKIINHPAFKTVTAAAACLVIALFVSRADIFGRIETVNDLDNGMITEDQNVVATNDGTEEYDEVISEGGYKSYSADYDNEAASGGGSMYSTGPSSKSNEEVDETTSGTTCVVTEEAAEAEVEIIEEEVCEDAADEIVLETETVLESTVAGDSALFEEEIIPECEEELIEEEIAYEEALPEDEEEIEEIITEPEVEVDSFDSVESYPYETPAANEPVDEFFSEATKGLKSFSIPDSETESTAKKIAYSSIAGSGLESGSYEKIILITAIDEDVNWDGIEDTYPNRFLCIDWLTDGEYNYEVFECTVNEKDDIVLDLFGGTASEILPDIVSGDFSNEITYLILVKTK